MSHRMRPSGRPLRLAAARAREAARQASELAVSIQQGIEGNLNDPQVFNDVLNSVENAYACMVDATSESSAEQFLNNMLDRITDPQLTDLIERAVQKAQDAKADTDIDIASVTLT